MLSLVNNNLNIDVHRKLMKEHKLETIADSCPGDKAAVDIFLSHADGYACRKGPDLPFPSLRCGFVLAKFGWTVGGASLKEGFTTAQARQATVTSEEVLDKALERMWNFSSTPDDNSTMSPEELSAVHQFKDTFRRLPDGSYEVTTPKKTPLPKLGESRSMALKRFHANERSLAQKGQLENFNRAMEEYITLGHAEAVPECDLSKPAKESYYVPIHMVTKESSTTTKHRPVFDASSKSSNGVSFNDLLLPGPSLYPLLSTLITQFHLHNVAFTGDISKMFRVIHLSSNERDYHRFLFRGRDRQIANYRMKRLTLGVSSLPYLSTQVLNQAAEDMQEQHPLAAATAKSCFYVNDYLSGAEIIDDAWKLWKQISEFCRDAGLFLRKFRSNSQELLSRIPKELQEKSPEVSIALDPTVYGKTLGIHWNTKSDSFHISTPVINELPPTKRSVASAAACLLDIMGWFGPVTLMIHNYLQDLWKLKMPWDAPIPEEKLTVWKAWSKDLHILSRHPIPRKLSQHASPVVERQLHLFTDASTKGYGGVVYLRQRHQDTSISIVLVTSKAKKWLI